MAFVATLPFSMSARSDTDVEIPDTVFTSDMFAPTVLIFDKLAV